jgi:hypothetical protein
MTIPRIHVDLWVFMPSRGVPRKSADQAKKKQLPPQEARGTPVSVAPLVLLIYSAIKYLWQQTRRFDFRAAAADPTVVWFYRCKADDDFCR